MSSSTEVVEHHATGPQAQFGSVVISEQWVAELDGTRRIVSVARSEVIDLEVLHCSGAERPLLAVLVGTVVLAVALSPVAFLIAVLLRGGHMLAKLSLMAAFAPIGVHLIGFGVRRRPVLSVRTARGRRKVVFQGKVDLQEAEEFVRAAAHRHGYAIHPTAVRT